MFLGLCFLVTLLTLTSWASGTGRGGTGKGAVDSASCPTLVGKPGHPICGPSGEVAALPPGRPSAPSLSIGLTSPLSPELEERLLFVTSAHKWAEQPDVTASNPRDSAVDSQLWQTEPDSSASRGMDFEEFL